MMLINSTLIITYHWKVKNYYHDFSRFAFFPKKKFSRKASYSESNKLIHSGQFVKIPFHTYVRLLDSLEL